MRMKAAAFAVGDAEDRLSVAHAMREGYKLTLDGDGCAEIVKPDGTAYHVHAFACDCPDAHRRRGGTYAGHCKHAVWVSQLRPCDLCGQTMALGEFKTAFGETARRFECPVCGQTKVFSVVRAERRAHRHGQAVTA